MHAEAGFAELLRRHEELTQRFARLLHDDAGQVLTAIALRLSVLDGVDPAELAELTGALDDLLERFRAAQNSLGAAVVSKRGLDAGLSLWKRSRPRAEVTGACGDGWSAAQQLAIYRIVEGLAPDAVDCRPHYVDLAGPSPVTDCEKLVAHLAGLVLFPGPETNTIRICHVNSGSHRGRPQDHARRDQSDPPAGG